MVTRPSEFPHRVARHLRRHVVGYIALFLVLGGTAGAAPPLKGDITAVLAGSGIKVSSTPNPPGDGSEGDVTVSFADCASGQVLKSGGPGTWSCAADDSLAGAAAGGDLTGTYPNPLIAGNAVSGAEVANDSLSGDDIVEASLGKVADADLLDGFNSLDFLRVTGGTMTGVLTLDAGVRANLGSAATPSYGFSADTNTGMFSPTNNRLSFATGGVERMTVSDPGRVGIGTSNPASSLHVPFGYIQFQTITGGAPPAADCDEGFEAGRVVVRTDGATNLYICTGATGWVGK